MKRMMVVRRLSVAWCCALSLGWAGTASAQDEQQAIEVYRAVKPIKVDGKLDEPIWNQAKAHALMLPNRMTPRDGDGTPREGGTVRFAWDEQYFYIGVEMVDRDVRQDGDRDQQHHYVMGDVVELFLKPTEASHYWEYYVTPNGLKTSFFYPDISHAGSDSAMAYESGQKVAATVQGVFNSRENEDKGWTAEMAIPLAELSEAGVPFEAGHQWTVLVGRYNYNEDMARPELSTVPRIPRPSFHRHRDYAPLRLLSAEQSAERVKQARERAAEVKKAEQAEPRAKPKPGEG